MPGNNGGDRVHNFFEQGSLSQDQRHTQLGEGSWPVFNNNVGSDRQIGGHLASSHKNYSGQHSESIERGNQFSLGPYGLNSTQSSLRPELLKNSSHSPQLNLNGFMHTPQVSHSRQNETNFLGVDAGPDRQSLTSRGLSILESQQRSILESQQRSGSPQTHPVSFGSSASPMNFNFFGGQQQMSGQQPGMMQSLPRQQFNDAQLMSQQLMLKQMQDMQRPLATNDAHLTPQQLMMKQMQDLQRQRQIHQFDAMQRNAASQIPTFPNQMAGQHSLAINGNPMYDASNYPWPSQAMAGNVNWIQQQGLSSPMQGYSNGFMITPEQGQALRFMGLTQQAPHSLYGVPVSNSRNDNTFSLNQFDNPGVPQVSAPSNSFPGNNQYAPLPEQAGVQGGAVSRPGSAGRNSLDHGSSQGLGNMVSFGSFNQMEQKNAPVSESGRQNSVDGFQLLPEKSETLATTKQADVGLDPTEEKILFGNDDNIWEAFGTTVMSTGGANRPDSADLCDGPPLLSGTWSALMQSAVAETSSTEAGMQEEWSGLDDQNTKSQTGNKQSSAFLDNVQEQSVWGNRSQQVPPDSQNASNNVNSNYVNSSGFQKSYLNQPSQSLPTESQLMPQAGKHWAFENANPSRDFSKTDVGFLSNQQSKFLHDNNERPSGRPNALNFIESVPANGSMASANQGNLHLREHTRHMSMDTSGTTQRPETFANYNVNMGNPRDDAAGPNSRNLVNHESKQNFHDNRHLDFWKSLNSSAQFGIDGAGKDRHTLSETALEPSFMGPDGGASDMHEAENGDVGENSNDSHQSSIQNQGLAGGLRENAWSDAGNRGSLHGGIEKPPVKPTPVTRKFQYHPMGDLDMDEDSFPSKQTMRPQPMPQHLPSGFRGHETQGRAFFHGRSKIADGVSSSGIPPGQNSNTSMPFGKSGQVSSQRQNLPPSQNMLELLHKVDQSEEQTSVSHLSSASGNRLNETAPAVKLNQQNQSSTSHGFNLQLAPPSQGVVPSNLSVTSQGSGTVDSPSSGFAAFGRGDKGHAAWLGSTQFPSSSHSLPQMTSVNDKSGSTAADGSLQNLKQNQSGPLASGSSYLRNPLQHHHIVGAGAKMTPDHTSLPFDKHSYLDRPISGSHEQATGRQSVSNSLNSLASGRGMNQFGLRPSMHQMAMSSSSMWSQHHLPGAHVRDAAELLKSHVQPNDAPGTSFFSEKQPGEQDHTKRADSEAQAQPTGKTLGGSEEEPVAKHLSEASPSNSAASQKDFENQSLLRQTQAVKSVVVDPSHHESKRLKGTGDTYASDSQEIMGQREHNSSGGENNMVGDPSVGQIAVSAGDAKVLNLAPQPGNRIPPFQLAHGTFASRETLPFGTSVTSGADHSGISPEIAPSWLQQYRTFKNGQSLAVHGMPRVPIARNVDPQSVSGMPLNNSDGGDSLQVASASTCPSPATDQTPNVNVPSEVVSSFDSLVPHVSQPAVASVTPKKRKTATSDLLSFSKEVGQSFLRPQSMSSAEVEWANSSNRLVEKIEDGTDAHDDMARLNRPKRRLMLTTQLMQQVFPSPSPAVLSLDASQNHETIVYSLARSALGDACNSVGCSERDSSVPPSSGNPVRGTQKTSDRVQNFSKMVEDFMIRAKELENELLRLDKRASILDFRLDLQDLDRFAVINRFARFHGRSQGDGPESSTSSSSSDPTTAIPQQRPLLQCPQRYVSAHPMPRNVPDRVQCLLL